MCWINKPIVSLAMMDMGCCVTIGIRARSLTVDTSQYLVTLPWMMSTLQLESLQVPLVAMQLKLKFVHVVLCESEGDVCGARHYSRNDRVTVHKL